MFDYFRTHRRRLILAAGVALVVFVGIGVWLGTQKDQGDTVDDPKTSEETIQTAPSEVTGLDEDEGHDVEEVEPPTVNQETISNDDIQQKAIPAARTASSHYIQQSTNETRDQRQERLRAVFHPSSSAIYDAPPAVDPTRTPNTSSTPSILHTTWYLEEDYIVVTVAMKITTTDNNAPERVVSEIYQAWDARVIVNDGVYATHTITYNKSPIVVDRN